MVLANMTQEKLERIKTVLKQKSHGLDSDGLRQKHVTEQIRKATQRLMSFT